MEIKKIMIFWVIWGMILPSFSIAQELPQVELPGTWQEIKETAMKALSFIPELLKGIWNGLMDFCQHVFNDLKNIWNSYVFPFLKNLWEKTIGKEFSERKPVIEEEFQKETQEVKEEIKTNLPNAKSFWERFKDLLK